MSFLHLTGVHDAGTVAAHHFNPAVNSMQAAQPSDVLLRYTYDGVGKVVTRYRYCAHP